MQRCVILSIKTFVVPNVDQFGSHPYVYSVQLYTVYLICTQCTVPTLNLCFFNICTGARTPVLNVRQVMSHVVLPELASVGWTAQEGRHRQSEGPPA